jgi:hypothetical protein
MEFTRISKTHFTIRESIFRVGPWKVFQIHTDAPSSRKTPWNFSKACNVALGAWRAAAPAQISVIRRRNRPGKGRRMARGSPATGLWPKLGSGRLRRRGATAAGVGGNGSSGSGELSAGAREWAALTALLGPRVGAEGVGWQWRQVERRLNPGGAHGAVASAAACARRANNHLNSRGDSLPLRRSKGARV